VRASTKRNWASKAKEIAVDTARRAGARFRARGNRPIAIRMGGRPWSSESALMKARVVVTLKTGILDPQGKAIEGALKSLGIDGVEAVRQGKIFDVELATENRAAAERLLRDACEKLLANQIIENFEVEIFAIFPSDEVSAQADLSKENTIST
jgi:phosphoribosylformylglycinamidine synthase subunit PurS